MNNSTIITMKKFEDAKKYWLNKLSGEFEEVKLFTDSSKTKHYSADNYKLSFRKEHAKQLIDLSKNNDLALFVLLLASFKILLFKVTNQNNITVVTPTYSLSAFKSKNNRFVPLRDHLYPGMTFKNVLTDVKETVTDGYRNQYYPIKKVFDILDIENSSSLFKVILLLEDIHEKEFIGDIIKDYENDILFSFRGREERLECEIIYNSKLFKIETIQNFCDLYLFVLSQVLNDTNIKLANIKLTGEEEKKKILYDFNNTKVEYPEDMTMDGLFEEQVKKTPHSIAVEEVEGNRRLSYEELNEWSNRLARLLRNRGVRPGHGVGIMIERSLEMIVGILGILKSGGAYLPIDPEYPERRIAYMLKDSGVELLLSCDRMRDRIVFEGVWIDLTREETYFLDSTNLEKVNRNDDLAYIIFTSGSTGKPKGVMVGHGSIVNTLYWRKNNYMFDQSDTILQIPSFSFDSSVEDIFTALISGSSLVLIPQKKLFDLEYLRNFLKNNTITHFLIVPGFYRTLVSEIDECLRNLKSVTIAGESFTVDLVHEHFKKFPAVKLMNEYGPTENSVCSTVFEFNQTSDIVLIGGPINNVSCFILDKYQNLNPVGIPGELCLSGSGLARGYLNRPELTIEKFVKHPCFPGQRMYRSGDLAKWCRDGNIKFLGRIDHQVKIRGFRIELGEIESRLQAIDGIKEVVVTAREEKNEERRLYAYCVPGGKSREQVEINPENLDPTNPQPAEERELNVSELRKKLIKDLPEYMVPSYFIQVEKIPVTPNGKVDRSVLDSYAKKLGTDVEYVPPETEKEKILADLWKEVLEVEQVGIHDNFFDLGGNSFFMVKLNSRLKEIFKKDIEVITMFEYPTISSFLNYLSQEENGDNSSAKEIKEMDLVHDEAANFMEQTIKIIGSENDE